MTDTKLSGLLQESNDLLDEAVDLRRRIHRHPEVGLDLPETQKKILEALDGLGYEIRTGAKTTSVVATLDGAHPGPTVLLRGDMDALPMPEDTGLDFASEVDNAMHACGHDTHVAMLATAAKLIARHREELHGRVLLMFQPGEEGHFGAPAMIDEGLLDGDRAPSAAFAIHITAIDPAGQISTKGGPLAASADTLLIDVKGRGGHASAPHNALDPIAVAAEIVLALQTMVTRTVNVFDPAVITIAHIEAGTTDNVIPERARLEGTLRALTPETRQGVIERAQRLVRSIGEAHGAEAQLDVDQGYPPTINDVDMAAFSLDVARDVLGDENVSEMDTPIMGAEDFSYVLQRVPGAMVRLGAAPPSVDHPAPNHSNRMIVHEPALANGIAMHAGWALRYLNGSRS
jgi:amidohydrolase